MSFVPNVEAAGAAVNLAWKLNTNLLLAYSVSLMVLTFFDAPLIVTFIVTAAWYVLSSCIMTYFLRRIGRFLPSDGAGADHDDVEMSGSGETSDPESAPSKVQA